MSSSLYKSPPDANDQQAEAYDERDGEIERLKDSIRTDQVSTSQWAAAMIIALIAITFVAMGNLVGQLNKFSTELRDIRDRITVIETERRMEREQAG